MWFKWNVWWNRGLNADKLNGEKSNKEWQNPAFIKTHSSESQGQEVYVDTQPM